MSEKYKFNNVNIKSTKNQSKTASSTSLADICVRVRNFRRKKIFRRKIGRKKIRRRKTGRTEFSPQLGTNWQTLPIQWFIQ